MDGRLLGRDEEEGVVVLIGVPLFGAPVAVAGTPNPPLNTPNTYNAGTHYCMPAIRQILAISPDICRRELMPSEMRIWQVATSRMTSSLVYSCMS